MSENLDTKTYSFDQAAAVLADLGFQRIVLDIDNVIFDTRRQTADIAQALAKEQGLPPLRLTPSAETAWDFLGVDEPSYRAAYARLVKEGGLAVPPPLIRGVRNGFSLFRQAGLQIDLLSSIPEALKPVRERQLRDAGLPFADIYTVQPQTSKGPALRTMAPALFIDDTPAQVDTALAAGCVGIVFHQPYNARCTAPRLQNWTVKAVTDLFGKLPAYIAEKRLAVGRSPATAPDPSFSILRND